MDSRIMDVLADRVLELGPKVVEAGPYRNFKLTHDGDGIAWLLFDRARLNVDGGAISLGHPVGCSGNRIVLHLVNAMKRLGTKRGIATECIGGGLGGAMLIETV